MGRYIGMDNESPFSVKFSDQTMIEGDGVYTKVSAIMDGELEPPLPQGAFPKIFPHEPKTDWMLPTKAIMYSIHGDSSFMLHFYKTKMVRIMGYEPSSANPYTAPDLGYLTMWCTENGWNIPQPAEPLVKENTEFWRYQFDTLVIDSDYMDRIYGVRKSLSVRDHFQDGPVDEENDEREDTEE
jgi:hypothetical protein